VMVFKLRFALRTLLQARSTGRAIQGRPPWWIETLRRLAETLTKENLLFYQTWIERPDHGRGRSLDLMGRLVRWMAPYVRGPIQLLMRNKLEERLRERATTASNAQDTSPYQGLPASLSPREREILTYMSAGWSNRRIAEECSLSLNTVRTHVQRILVKLGVHSKLDAIHFVSEHQS
jgi:DNA-binding CsgD family transcriptional regulator